MNRGQCQGLVQGLVQGHAQGLVQGHAQGLVQGLGQGRAMGGRKLDEDVNKSLGILCISLQKNQNKKIKERLPVYPRKGRLPVNHPCRTYGKRNSKEKFVRPVHVCILD
jgi:hypothetical protein